MRLTPGVTGGGSFVRNILSVIDHFQSHHFKLEAEVNVGLLAGAVQGDDYET